MKSKRINPAFCWLETLLFLAALPTSAQAQSIEWIRQFGSASNDQASGVALDATGRYVVGRTDGTLPGQSSAGSVDAFVRKYDLNGNVVWARQFGSTNIDQAFAVTVDGTGVYVAGDTAGTLPVQANAGGIDAFVRKYNADGAELWTRQFGSSGNEGGLGLAVSSTGIYVVGTTAGILPGQTSAGGNDAFVRKYDLNGNEQWTRQFGTSANDQALALSASSSDVYAAGTTEGTLPGQTSAGGQDAFFRKYDANGTEQWTRQFGSAGFDQALAAATDSSGTYVAGSTQSTLPGQISAGGGDAFVRKYLNGNEVWTRQFGTPANDVALAVTTDGTNVFLSGGTGGVFPGQTSAGGSSDAFVRRYDAGGTAVWTRQFGSAGFDTLRGIAATIAPNIGRVYASGYTDGALPGQTSAGVEDAFVGKFFTSGAQTVIFSDSSFQSSDWALTIFRTHAAAGSSIASQEASGGNTGSFRQVNITVNGQGQSVSVSGLHINLTATYDPRVRGAIDFIYYSEDIIFLGVGCCQGQGTGPALRQNGKFYTAGSLVTFLPASWTTFGLSGLRAEDFYEVIGGSSFLDGTSHPDFSATGSPIDFGFRRGNTSAGQYTSNFGIDNWSVIVSQPLPPGPAVSDGGVVNNASFAPSPAPVAPGSIAAVFGSNLNDGSAVQFSSYGPDGKLVTSLGGASATINNIPAPMFYSFPTQLGVQVPFELEGQTTGTIVVTVGGQSSVPRTINLDAFAPGIFTVNQQGTDIAAVLHQDGITPVTAQNPAHPGEVVVLFVTGLGAVTPALMTGSPSVGNRTATAPSVTIDGVPVVPDFSGAAPGYVGLYQINVRIPASTRTSSSIPVVVSIGGKQSNAVTIPVGP